MNRFFSAENIKQLYSRHANSQSLISCG